MSQTVFDFTAERLDGKPDQLANYQGKVLLIVNTASECRFTPQYAGLEALYKKYEKQGLVVMGFPCNQFGSQEPGDADAIGSFCEKNFGVTFPMFAKVDVNGADAHPLWKHLKSAAPGVLGTEGIKWNFTKFLVGKNGKVVDRFAPTTKPEDLGTVIEGLLKD